MRHSSSVHAARSTGAAVADEEGVGTRPRDGNMVQTPYRFVLAINREMAPGNGAGAVP
jgi:hypothetical protein